jgi:drug/metabolite transporter (DMT)-like permease
MNPNWFLLSLSALVCLSSMSFLITVLAKRGLPVSFILLGIGVIFVLYYSAQTFVFSQQKFDITASTLLLLLIIGVLSALGNLFLYQAAATAPNAGLALAVSGMQSSVVALLAFMVFKNTLTPLQIVGIVFAVMAIFLINLGNPANQPKAQAAEVKAENK